MKQTKRKFYRTEIKVVVLSEDPVDFDGLAGVHFAITAGDCSGSWCVTKATKLNGKQAVRALKAQGSDPCFFQLTESGEDAYE